MKLTRTAIILGLLLLAPVAWAQGFLSQGAASLAVTTSTGNVALPGTGPVVMIANVGSAEAFVKFGGSTVTAATTDESIANGHGRCFQVQTQTYVAAITAASTATLRISQGIGPCAQW